MGESRTDAALNIVEISGLAWALTVHKAAEVLAIEAADADLSAYRESAQAEASRQVDAEDSPAMEAELRRAGIVDGHGAITRQWVLAVWIAALAPVKAAVVVQTRDLSVHTEIGLARGRGVGITYHRRIRHGLDGVGVTEVRTAVEVSFFHEENAWAAIRRHLPDFTDVQPTVRTTPHDAVANATCTVHLEVSARPIGSGPGSEEKTYVRKDVWALADRLYSLRTSPAEDGGPAVTEVPSSDISREFVWRLLGAREYLAGAVEKAA
jgi:hypothetical protein